MTLTGLRRPSLPFSLLLCLVLAGPAAAEGVRIVLPQRVTANDQFLWSFAVRVVNGLDTGFYTDSLICMVEEVRPGQSRPGWVRRIPLNAAIKSLRTISARDSAVARYHGFALAEHARMTFLLRGHDANDRAIESEATTEILPSPISRQYPSRFLEGKERIEYVFVPEVWPTAPSPGVLLVHDENSHARQLLPLAWELANLGFSVLMASLPGYGESAGEPDFAGPATVKALGRSLQHLRRSPGVDSTRVAVWGFSRGATAAALLAENRQDLEGVVLQSGIYDLRSAYDATASERLRADILREAGKKGEGWKRRSPSLAARRLLAPVLLIHGERDSVAMPQQAAEMARVLRVEGRAVTLEMIPDAAHSIPAAVVLRPALDFLRQRLRPAKQTRG